MEPPGVAGVALASPSPDRAVQRTGWYIRHRVLRFAHVGARCSDRLRSLGVSPPYQVVAFGHAIVDEVVFVQETDVAMIGREKGSMTLSDASYMADLRERFGLGKRASGGSAANTAAGLALLGASVGYVGRLGDDELGRDFEADLIQTGAVFLGRRVPGQEPSGSCLVMVTPDGERTMATHLGASALLGGDDFDPAIVAAGTICYLEGYLWDSPSALAILGEVSDACRRAGGRVAVSLSDAGCVQRHRQDFADALAGAADLVLGNEGEFGALVGSEEPLRRLRLSSEDGATAVVTLAEKGSVVVADGQAHRVPAVEVGNVVDATGAGDLYAAGFIRGLLAGAELADCARLGSAAAARVLTQLGARPASLDGLLSSIGIR